MSDPANFPAGVVTLLQWMMMPDGSVYQYVYAPSWRVVTNAATNIPKFRSVEKWHLVHYAENGEPLIVIPGCQVKCWARCEKNPSLRGGAQVYSVRDGATA